MLNEKLFAETTQDVRRAVSVIEESIKGTKFEGKTYLVGGSVRDLILGLPVKDLDFVVECEGGGIQLATFLAVKHKCFKQGKNPVVFERFGTARLRLENDDQCNHLDLEFVETRKEAYETSSRNPSVKHGTILEDAKRRDLTINALYYNLTTGQVIDVLEKSFNDINNKILRTPTNPNITFSDDPLRMLRVIRFSARYNWGIEKETWLGILKNNHRIYIISQERITDEITKILLSKNPGNGLRKLYFSGLLGNVMPDFYETTKVVECGTNKNLFDHTLAVVDSTMPSLVSRLAAVYHDLSNVFESSGEFVQDDMTSAKFAETELKNLKFPKDVITGVMCTIMYHRVFFHLDDNKIPSDKNLRRLMSCCDKYLVNVLDLMQANNIKTNLNAKPNQALAIIKRINELRPEYEKYCKTLPIKGDELAKELKVKGAIIGKIIELLKEEQLGHPKISKEVCLKIAREFLAKNNVRKNKQPARVVSIAKKPTATLDELSEIYCEAGKKLDEEMEEKIRRQYAEKCDRYIDKYGKTTDAENEIINKWHKEYIEDFKVEPRIDDLLTIIKTYALLKRRGTSFPSISEMNMLIPIYVEHMTSILGNKISNQEKYVLEESVFGLHEINDGEVPLWVCLLEVDRYVKNRLNKKNEKKESAKVLDLDIAPVNNPYRYLSEPDYKKIVDKINVSESMNAMEEDYVFDWIDTTKTLPVFNKESVMYDSNVESVKRKRGIATKIRILAAKELTNKISIKQDKLFEKWGYYIETYIATVFTEDNGTSARSKDLVKWYTDGVKNYIDGWDGTSKVYLWDILDEIDTLSLEVVETSSTKKK